MRQMGIGTIYVAGPSTRYDLLAELARLGLKGATVIDAAGIWEGEHELSYVVTIVAPIASEARLEVKISTGDSFVLPGNPDALEQQLRFVAENLAMTFGQQQVIWFIAPTLAYGVTTRQASYRRDTSRAEQTSPVYQTLGADVAAPQPRDYQEEGEGLHATPILPAGRHEAQAEARGIDWREASKTPPSVHVANPVTNPELPEPERGNFGPAVIGDASAVRAYRNASQANAHNEADDDIAF